MADTWTHENRHGPWTDGDGLLALSGDFAPAHLGGCWGQALDAMSEGPASLLATAGQIPQYGAGAGAGAEAVAGWLVRAGRGPSGPAAGAGRRGPRLAAGGLAGYWQTGRIGRIRLGGQTGTGQLDSWQLTSAGAALYRRRLRAYSTQSWQSIALASSQTTNRHCSLSVGESSWRLTGVRHAS